MARDLQTSYRNGRLLAAYLYLVKRPGQSVARSQRQADGIVVDFDDQGVPLGLEFVSPSAVTLSIVNRVLESLEQPLATFDELWPILRRQTLESPAA